MLAALSDGTTTLENALFSEDSQYFASALNELGFSNHLESESNSMTVRGLAGNIPASRADIFIGNAGTAARFLTAMLTLGRGEYRIFGSVRMHQRPIGDLVGALNNLGAHVEASRPDIGSVISSKEILATSKQINEVSPGSLSLPTKIRASGLAGGTTKIRGDISSQFLSGLLMVAPCAEKPVEIIVEGALSSRPYIDLTIGVMADFEVQVQRQGYSKYTIWPQPYHSPGPYSIESDASGASYFFAAPAICGGWVEVENMILDSRQGDIRFLEILQKMGCEVSSPGGAIRVSGPDIFTGIEINMSDISDTFMTLAAIAPFANTPTTIRGIASSRLKETDRVSAVCAELRRLGVEVYEYPDGMTINPCNDVRPGRVHTYDDHRIAMAFSLVGLRVQGIEIENPGCVAKTFPGFFDVLSLLK
jgi:3-phosphoshikimate 1-carboxyvinyltransferase